MMVVIEHLTTLFVSVAIILMPYGIQKARTGMPDEWIADRLIDLGLLKEAFIKEDAPFGSGMELLRMAIMRKFITVQEWDLLKHKWKEAAAEVEEKYSDWPEDEGFGLRTQNVLQKI